MQISFAAEVVGLAYPAPADSNVTIPVSTSLPFLSTVILPFSWKNRNKRPAIVLWTYQAANKTETEMLQNASLRTTQNKLSFGGTDFIKPFLLHVSAVVFDQRRL